MAVAWFRFGDLRTVDNPALLAACGQLGADGSFQDTPVAPVAGALVLISSVFLVWPPATAVSLLNLSPCFMFVLLSASLLSLYRYPALGTACNAGGVIPVYLWCDSSPWLGLDAMKRTHARRYV